MRALFLLITLFLGGCSAANLNIPVIYKMEVQQGNEIDSKMLLKLKPGMTKVQVKFILGTPLIVDSFHKDRWDYIYVLRKYDETQKNTESSERRHVILKFENQLLKSIAGEVIPSNENLNVNKIEKIREYEIEKKLNDDQRDIEENSWVEKIKFWKSEGENERKDIPQKLNLPTKKEELEKPSKKIDSKIEDQKKVKELKMLPKPTDNKKNKGANTWIEKIKFWESDDNKQIKDDEQKTYLPSQKNELEGTKKDKADKKTKQISNTNKNTSINSDESINVIIKKDMSQEIQNNKSLKDKVNTKKPAKSKQDIIDRKIDEPDYFDLMLEKIGF